MAELEAAEEARHAEQVVELTDLAVAIHGGLMPVLGGLHEYLPVDGPPSQEAPAASELEAWSAAVDDASARLGDPPSASTEINLTRQGISLTLELLDSALRLYAEALEAEGGQHERLVALASELRADAVASWSPAALQLDQLNIDAGHGHVHLSLPLNPDDPGAGPHDLDTHDH
ncbi:hypothetical protein [Phytoactinopolyspora halotolerans]|uniref:Uncharacterized protein n=1 Tax=Phytoactinopolyspora halotolerans TaxID=1981512 RepID=A0A6L9SDN6_9ACTN|nr:hypothetical protein [Phytoactinopolyspora halotolerans]NEE03495.1 hypothetical protein [Phytoactinopolyspora halotolerans]